MHQPGKVANPARGQLNGENEYPLSPYGPENLVSRDGSRVSLLILHTQAESGAYSRDSSRFLRRRPFIYLNRHTPLGQSLLYRVITQFRTNDVHCRESAGTGPVVLKVVPATGAAILQVTTDQIICASLFPHPLLAVMCGVSPENCLRKLTK